jgi:hypothetical protein
MGDISLRGRGKAYLASTKTSTREKFSEGGKPEVLKEEKKGIFGFFKKTKEKPKEKKGIFGFFKKTKEKPKEKKSDNTYPESQIKSNTTIKKQRLKELDAELGIKREEKPKGGAIKKK